MTPESDRDQGSGWLIVLALAGLVVLIAAGGTLWGFVAARRATETAELMRAQAERMRDQAESATQRAEAEARRAEEESLRARHAEEEARTRALKADAVRDFLAGTLTTIEPVKPGEQRAGVRSALDQVAERLDRGEVTDLNTAASLHSTLGLAYESLGEIDAALKHLGEAVDLRRRATGEASPELTADLENLARVSGARAK